MIERRSFERASAIHFTSDLEPRPNVARDEHTLVFIGRINWKKGLDRTIELLSNLDAHLVIAGNDEENLTPKLQAQASQLGVADRVEFHGPVYGDAKFELLARASLFVLLSTSENFGNAVLEALMMETPVVLSNEVGLARDVVKAGAGTTNLDEVQALLAGRARRDEMGQKGRALVESKFTWPQVAAQMEDAYRCSIASRP